MIEALKPYAMDLLKACVATLAKDNEENALVASRIAFDLHKTFRPNLEEPVPEFLEFGRKVCQSGPCHAVLLSALQSRSSMAE